MAITFDPADDARAFARENGFDWPIIAEATGFIEQVGVATYPTMALVSPDGLLMAKKVGLPGTSPGGSKNESGWLEQWVNDALSTGN